jgi:putative flippase GtrA
MVRHVFADGWLSQQRVLEMALFGLSGAIGAAVTYLSVLAFIVLFGMHLHGAKIAAVAIRFVIVFIFRRLVVFRNTMMYP